MKHLDETTIDALLSGSGEAASRASAEAHLADCEECSARVQALVDEPPAVVHAPSLGASTAIAEEARAAGLALAAEDAALLGALATPYALLEVAGALGQTLPELLLAMKSLRLRVGAGESVDTLLASVAAADEPAGVAERCALPIADRDGGSTVFRGSGATAGARWQAVLTVDQRRTPAVARLRVDGALAGQVPAFARLAFAAEAEDAAIDESASRLALGLLRLFHAQADDEAWQRQLDAVIPGRRVALSVGGSSPVAGLPGRPVSAWIELAPAAAARTAASTSPLGADAIALLEQLGQPRSLASVALGSGRSRGALAGTMRELRAVLAAGHPAFEAARARVLAVCPRYEAWDALEPVGDAELPSGAQLGVARAGGADAPRVLTQPPTSGPYSGDEEVMLELREEQAGGWITRVNMHAPIGHPATVWEFRLCFAPEAEAAALEKLALDRRTLGVLRVVHGERRWSSLLDLLLPLRFAASDDPIFSAVIEAAGVRGRLPDWPLSFHFWAGPRRGSRRR